MASRQYAHTVFIGAGSNIGDRTENLQQAIYRLEELPKSSVTRVSRVYYSEPLGPVEQQWFYNAVFEMHTELAPETLLSCCRQTEIRMGRPAGHAPWGPRTIDLDILLYDDMTCELEHLIIPHPELSNRKFVLLPLLDLVNPLHPVSGRTMEELLATCPDRSIIECLDPVCLKIA